MTRPYNQSQPQNQERRFEHMPGPFVYRWSVLQAAHRTALNSLPADAPRPLQNVYLDPITSPKASPVEVSSTATPDKQPVLAQNYNGQTTEGLTVQQDVTTQSSNGLIDTVQAAQNALHEARSSTELTDAIKGYADAR